MYQYAFKIEYKKSKEDKDYLTQIIFAKSLEEAKRVAHEKYWNEKWYEFKVDFLKFNAFARYLRTSYKKLKPILDLIRGKNLDEAINIVAFIPRKAARMVEKLLMSVKANIEYLSDRYKDLNINNFFIYELYVTKGPYIKRWDAKFRGMATKILRPTSHLTVRVAYKEPIKKLKKEKEAVRR
ncbi:MAG: 50S ribosomal protein L22 [Candidatus Calescibacterium sp.]|nr:50S ribosomal protein L22 [Candidatus Calescibacterium sp.]MCX7972705.1 50S ribosomal protein L22 [bacterium]MDW8195509.1 50S ribosomal protein L22 [Candidatus Calescibacterium sp.]